VNPAAGATARIDIRTARRHATETEYAAWVKAFIPNQAARYERMASYRRFVRAWPDLEDWFRAPLLVRAGFTGAPLRATGRTGTFRLIADAEVRGWPREIERHQATQRRIKELLRDLDQKPGSG
jgi:hypothetical protein